MSELFPNQSYGVKTLQHRRLPIYVTSEFDFFRCVPFNDSFYGKTVSEMQRGNLRETNSNNRYAKLFPCKRISYWADSVYTARSEVKYHYHTNNLLTFWAYDDASSTFPTLPLNEPLYIIDGLQFSFHIILDKFEQGYKLSQIEKNIIRDIIYENPDCLAYKSQRKYDGINFLFFENGFNKLALREVQLNLGDYPGKNHNRIYCAGTSDYAPYLEGYGVFFEPIAKTTMNANYLRTKEYALRHKIYSHSILRRNGR